MKDAFKKAFPRTLPVMAGFLSLGIAFGILMDEIGYGGLWAPFMSLVVLGGSAQFLCVELLLEDAPLTEIALLVFLLNFRHFFYGLTMLPTYRKVKRKPYLIFALTDESYALLSTGEIPEGVDRDDYYFASSLLMHMYWVAGGLLGSIAGALITFDMTGIDFALTALFAVLVVEQWKSHSQHFPAILGFGVSILALRIFGTDNFIIPTLVIICAVLLVCRRRLEGQHE